jgi:enterochelin esterase family protein
MSAYVPNPHDLIAPAFADPGLNEKLHLLWGSIGTDDYLRKETEEFNALLKAKGIHQQFYLTPGSHEWSVWRGYLRDFALLLFR